MQLLVVCTANICRSRLAEAYLLKRAEQLEFTVAVASVGVQVGDLDVPKEVALRLGIRESEARRGRQIANEDIRQADLILCMTRAHVRDVVVMEPGAWTRTFTLKEIVRRGESLGSRRMNEPLEVWLGRLSIGRAMSDLLGDSDSDDVADPYGGDAAEYEATANELEVLTRRVLDLI